jgi:hypothetical protein
MTSYIFELKKCLDCQEEFLTISVRSCNTIDAVYYTDGYISGPMYDEGSYIVHCPKCKSYHFESNLDTVKRISESDYSRSNYGNEPFKNSITLQHFKHFEHLLSNPIWKNAEQEQFIRIRAWWACNNEYRKNFKSRNPIVEEGLNENGLPQSTEFLIAPEHKKNLMRIIELLDFRLEEDRLLMAEIYRELGNFDKSISLLDFDFSECLKVYVSTIKKLCNEQVCKVEVINFPAPEEKELYELVNELRQPKNGMEKHFLQVLAGRAIPCSMKEKEWYKWWLSTQAKATEQQNEYVNKLEQEARDKANAEAKAVTEERTKKDLP